MGIRGVKRPHPLGSVPSRTGASQLLAESGVASVTLPGVKISALPAAGGATISDQLEANQSGTSRSITVAQVSAAVQSTLPPVDWSAITGKPSTFPPGGPASGDLNGSYPGPTIRPSVTNGQVLTTVGGVSAWAAPAGGAPSGAAGGDLTGTYPNPTLNPEVIDDRVAALLVAGTNITLNYNDPANTLTINSTASGGGGGTVTSVAAGTGLSASPSPIVAAGTLSLANTAVTTGTYGNSTNVAQFTVDQQGRLTFAGNVAISAGGSGTVTNVSVVNANGLNGTVANATTTPAITLSTTVTGLLKGNGTAISAATAGTDYVTPGGLPTSLPPNGAASGDLAGTYPSPTIKASVGLTGTPTVPTATAGTNTTQAASTAFVATAVAAVSAPTVVVTTKFTSSGTWTPNSKMVYAKAQGWGAGGAGGSTVTAAASVTMVGGGGAAGSWAKVIISKATAGASQTVTIGAAAAQPAAGNTAGGAGGDTSLGALLVAKGGAGGAGQPTAATGGAGGLGVVAGNVGDETGPGMSGQNGTASIGGGAGGSAPPIGSGGRGVAGSITTFINGETAIGFASGGGGGGSSNAGGTSRGGVGTGGYIVIEEYCTP